MGVAPKEPLPNKKYLIVEHPGNIQNVDEALKTLGGIENIQGNFKTNEPWELKFRHQDHFSLPIVGYNIRSKSQLIKVTRTIRRKKGNLDDENAQVLDTKCQIVGSIDNIVRFRNLSDFQTKHQNPQADELAEFVEAIRNLDVEKIWKMPTELSKYDRQDPSSFFPPNLYSYLSLPFSYNFKQESRDKTKLHHDDNSKDPEYRYFNEKQKEKFFRLVTTSENYTVYYEPPDKYKSVQNENKEVYQMAKKLFDERPIWNAPAFRKQFENRKDIDFNRILPALAYYVVSGAFRETWVRYGYDPTKDKESRYYQSLDLRNTNKRFIREDHVRGDEDGKESHIFDVDQNKFSGASLIQLCDIRFQRINKYLDDTNHLLDKFDSVYGWFKEAIHKRIYYLMIKTCFTLKENPNKEWEVSKAPKGKAFDLEVEDSDSEKIIELFDRYKAVKRKSNSKKRTQMTDPEMQHIINHPNLNQDTELQSQVKDINLHLREQNEGNEHSTDEDEDEQDEEFGFGMLANEYNFFDQNDQDGY